MSLQRREQTIAWELRGFWAKRCIVVAVLSDRCLMKSITGRVERVSVTGATCEIDGWEIPTEDVLTARRALVHEADAYKELMARRREERLEEARRAAEGL